MNFSSQSNTMQSFYISEGCLGGDRFIYSEGIFQMSGQQLDFSSGKLPPLGQLIANQSNNCSKAFFSGSDSDKQNCRGPLDSKCAGDLDQACKNSGLYNLINANPQTSSPYPDDCNDSSLTYTDQGCFSWIMKNLTKGTVTFDYQKFQNLPAIISQSIAVTTTSNLRYLQSTVVVGTDVTSKDTKAYSIVSNAKLADSDLTVDSATATTVPSANTYINDLNNSTATIKLVSSSASSTLRVSLSMILIVLIGLFL
jgi:hypothetical protein